VTDANGLYAFRDLPAGEYTIVATHDGQEQIVAVTVPDGPAFMKEMDVAVVPAQTSVTQPNRTSTPATSVATNTLGSHTKTAERGVIARISESHAKSIEATESGGSFTIQVAASNNARHARAMVDELKEAGHAAYLVEPVPSGTVAPYQVRVGHYPTLAEANRSASTLEKSLGWRLRIMASVPPRSSTNPVGQVTPVSYSR
jgi:cell division septation protein DedD